MTRASRALWYRPGANATGVHSTITTHTAVLYKVHPARHSHAAVALFMMLGCKKGPQHTSAAGVARLEQVVFLFWTCALSHSTPLVHTAASLGCASKQKQLKTRHGLWEAWRCSLILNPTDTGVLVEDRIDVLGIQWATWGASIWVAALVPVAGALPEAVPRAYGPRGIQMLRFRGGPAAIPAAPPQ